jgi:hypothetical protein
MPKLSLKDNIPPFHQTVGIPTHGDKGGIVPVEFTFIHRSKKAMDEFMDFAKSNKDEVATIKKMVSGWNLDDEFNDDSIALLLEMYAGAGVAVFNAYVLAIYQIREKN